jgi:hypothetical protein
MPASFMTASFVVRGAECVIVTVLTSLVPVCVSTVPTQGFHARSKDAN